MRNFIILVSILWVGFLIWAMIDYNKRKKQNNKNGKPPFRTDEDLDEYAKPMKDEHQSGIDFDDAE